MEQETVMRIRTIKPEFWMHEGMTSLPPLTRLLAIGLLNWADDEGYFLASAKLIRGSILPFEDDSSIIPRMLYELSSVGWITLGTDSQGREVGHVTNFSKHQRVDRPQRTKIEGFKGIDEDSANAHRDVVEQSKEEWNGMERKRKGKDTSPVCVEFELFWEKYPRKESKRDAIKAWQSMEDAPPIEEHLGIIARWSATEKWTKDGGKYIPLPATWIRGQRWTDQLQASDSSHNGYSHSTEKDFAEESQPYDPDTITKFPSLAR